MPVILMKHKFLLMMIICFRILLDLNHNLFYKDLFYLKIKLHLHIFIQLLIVHGLKHIKTFYRMELLKKVLTMKI